MLELANAVKTYGEGESEVKALQGINLSFPEHGMVSILGASGCGKTTLLNIVGGLDRLNSGELIVDGKSTALYKQSDWNKYRNHIVGFVFQNYYLIPHLNVLDNVKLAMNLSGLSSKEQKEKALKALKKVGLIDQIRKKPKQLSGGQAQRVAIARAIANKPKIILADEPTGALDSENSIQILELLKKLSKEILVVIVTHNAELANQYSDRIIKMSDGQIINDFSITSSENSVLQANSNESQSDNQADKISFKIKKRNSMSPFSAFKASLKNLYYKKGRTIITSIAGCLGVVSIALILGLNSGFSIYANEYQKDSLSKYPITVAKTHSSIEEVKSLFAYVDGMGGDFTKFDTNAILSMLKDKDTDMTKYTEEEIVFIEKMITGIGANIDDFLKENDTTEFKKYVDKNFQKSSATVKYDYKITPNVYDIKTTQKESGEEIISSYKQITPFSERTGDDLEYLNSLLQAIGLRLSSNDIQNIKSALSGISFWDSLVNDYDVLDSQYSLLSGRWPSNNIENNVYEAVLVVDEYNRLTDASLYALGYIEFIDLLKGFLVNSKDILSKLTGTDFNIAVGEELNVQYDFNDFIGHEFHMLLDSDYYVKNSNGYYENKKDDVQYIKTALNSAPTIRISGIVRLREGVDSGCINGDIGYSQALVDYIIDKTLVSPVVVEQKEKFDEYKLLTKTEEYKKYEELIKKIATGEKNIEMLTEEERILMATQSEISIKSVVQNVSLTNESSYETLLLDLGVKDKDSPESVKFYPSSVEAVDEIEQFIADYNANMKAKFTSGEIDIDPTVKYTNELDSIMANLTSVIDTITYILIAVTCLAVIVSLFMVGIIMYISVQDRTKEIGIMRSMGARKIDIMNIFNAETIVLGLLSGIIGVAIAYSLTPLANLLLAKYLGIANLINPIWWHSVIIILCSVVLTCLSGLFPAIFASKKDPVTSLRTE